MTQCEFLVDKKWVKELFSISIHISVFPKCLCGIIRVDLKNKFVSL